MKKKKSPKSDVAPELQAATSPYSKTSARCSPVPTNMPKSVNGMDSPGADPGPPVSFVDSKERAIIEELVRALQGIDIDGLPEGPRGDTLRGLQQALESTVSPQIEPRDQHRVPFNISLTKDEAAAGKAAINAAWEISSFVLAGLHCLRPRGYVSLWGAEVPAMWSPGDFSSALESARHALARLEALNEKLGHLKSRRVRVQSSS